ncbi:hypothetical protein COU58_03475 [Candidatus Pacearchaeota archaeon CG10_big_fil_rev_8_21_14_0_10_32_42]|nr:MAG: hypothetical protein COU58_03475 [Candidatus Pacearchaeota archaeon CG10_big_fil_rev_8_21_14_0_10_32_42]
MERVLVLIDAGFLSKVSHELGEGHYFKYDILKFSKNLCGKFGSVFHHLFFYNAPPYQNTYPSQDQKKRKEDYDSFISKLSRHECVTIREGRCQRVKNDGRYIYKQKGVDTLLTMDLMEIPIEYPKIKQIILIASDSDFVPVIQKLRKRGIKVILYTYFDRVRDSNFSRSNELIKSVNRYIKLKKSDFEDCRLI